MPMVPVHIYDSKDNPIPDNDYVYVIAQNGNFLKKRTGLISAMIPVSQISVLETVQSYASMNIEKIPSNLVGNIWAFFEYVCQNLSSESVVLLYYNEEQKSYIIRVPEQEVASGGVKYKNKFKNPVGYLCVGTIHSHANFSAFHSFVDKNDEMNFDGLHITIGHNKKELRSIEASVVINGTRIKVDPNQYLDGIEFIEKEEIKTKNPFVLLSDEDYFTSFCYPQFHEYIGIGSNTVKETGWIFSASSDLKTFPSEWKKRVKVPEVKKQDISITSRIFSKFNYQSNFFKKDIDKRAREFFLGEYNPHTKLPFATKDNKPSELNEYQVSTEDIIMLLENELETSKSECYNCTRVSDLLESLGKILEVLGLCESDSMDNEIGQYDSEYDNMLKNTEVSTNIPSSEFSNLPEDIFEFNSTPNNLEKKNK